jgi:hypothetical protein
VAHMRECGYVCIVISNGGTVTMPAISLDSNPERLAKL